MTGSEVELSYTDWVAIYAGLVATAALALEVRRWTESGPKLRLSVSQVMHVYDGRGAVGDEGYIFATMVNRGSLPSSIEAVAIMSFRSIFHRIVLFKNYWAALVLRPYPNEPLPHVINPGEIWKGGVIYDEELKQSIAKQAVFVAVYVSHRNRPMLKRIVLRKALEAAESS